MVRGPRSDDLQSNMRWQHQWLGSSILLALVRGSTMADVKIETWLLHFLMPSMGHATATEVKQPDTGEFRWLVSHDINPMITTGPSSSLLWTYR
jgi:hypothetical protein